MDNKTLLHESLLTRMLTPVFSLDVRADYKDLIPEEHQGFVLAHRAIDNKNELTALYKTGKVTPTEIFIVIEHLIYLREESDRFPIFEEACRLYTETSDAGILESYMDFEGIDKTTRDAEVANIVRELNPDLSQAQTTAAVPLQTSIVARGGARKKTRG